jgi:hypothetical protein
MRAAAKGLSVLGQPARYVLSRRVSSRACMRVP